MNLLLKLNKSLTNIQDPGPYTPLDQTLKTPLDPPANYFNQGFIPPGAPHLQSFHQQSNPQPVPQNSVYGNPRYNESDDILTDATEDNSVTQKNSKNYTLNFTTNFDHLIMTIYSHILSLPTTTPFSGTMPPSGLVSKVANETMMNLINDTANKENPSYDQQQIINYDMLNNTSYQPIFLQLIRKRLLELCANKNDLNKLPVSTSITITNTTQGAIISNGPALSRTNSQNPYGAVNNNPYGSSSNNPYGNNVRQSSISNLSLTDLNISNYQQQQQQQQQDQNRSRAASVNLRKQSLTRNNSYSNGNNWLHVGNLNTIKNPNESTDSLQSMQDFVPQPFINRSAPGSSGNNNTTPSNQGFSHMMMDYQTPPSSNKSSFSTPPSNGNGNNVQIVHGGSNLHVPNAMDFDEFNFTGDRSRSNSAGSKQNNFPKPLTINTDNANLQALNSLTGNADTLDSPFMSATTPSEDFQMMMHAPHTPNNHNHPGNNGFLQTPIPESPNEDERALPFNKVSLSEKKRDSLKLKRGIH